jgi:hypothetical protein
VIPFAFVGPAPTIPATSDVRSGTAVGFGGTGTLDVMDGGGSGVTGSVVTVMVGTGGSTTPNVGTFGGTAYNIRIAQNEGKVIVFDVKLDDDGTLTDYDLTGKTVEFLTFTKAGVINVSKSTTDGSITLSSNQASVTIAPEDTDAAGLWLWQLRITTDHNAYAAGGEWRVFMAPLT